jgi:hypothetical protein
MKFFGVRPNNRSGNGMFAAEHTQKFIGRKQISGEIVKRVHHGFGSFERLELFERVNTDFINLGIGFFVVKLHIARGVNDRHRARARSRAVRNRALVTDRQHQNSRRVKI